MMMATPSKDLSPLDEPFFPTTFIRNQFRTAPRWLPKDTDLSEQTAIVTGSNTGLGFESARQLLSYKLSHLILAVRSSHKGEAAASKLRAQYPASIIEVWDLDMGSYASIQHFAKRAETQLTRVDIAILNAGLGSPSFVVEPSTGHERIFQINYLSTILLCILLLPVLKRKSPQAKPGRITISSAALSLTSKFANRDAVPLIPSFDDPKTFDAQERYNLSKTLAHFFIYKLAETISADDVVVNLADPGFVAGTELARDLSGFMRLLFLIFAALTARKIDVGASTYLDAAIAKGKESHGCFLMSWSIQGYHALFYTPEGKRVANTLWEETLEELQFANVKDVIASMK